MVFLSLEFVDNNFFPFRFSFQFFEGGGDETSVLSLKQIWEVCSYIDVEFGWGNFYDPCGKWNAFRFCILSRRLKLWLYQKDLTWNWSRKVEIFVGFISLLIEFLKKIKLWLKNSEGFSKFLLSECRNCQIFSNYKTLLYPSKLLKLI